ncbi:MAG: hypothetical protein MK135_04210 [Polyangiaceae bacterium]|nr:hypothetical protein [Polyangiaceae bacterium]
MKKPSLEISRRQLFKVVTLGSGYSSARGLLNASAASLLLAGVACEEEEEAEVVPGGVLWDNDWAFVSTSVKKKDGTSLPFPTDYDLVQQVRYGAAGAGGAPPVGDALEGAGLVFELDGRILLQPEGLTTWEYFGSRYRVNEAGKFRASVRKTLWFPYEYAYDQLSGTLLLSPLEERGEFLIGLILDVISATLYSGALDSAAARVTQFLFEDPRVAAALDEFLHQLIGGKIAELPEADPAEVTDWLILLLRENEIVPPGTPDRVLKGVIQPIIESLLPLDRDGIADRLVNELIDSGVIGTVISPERIDGVLRFALYRRLLTTGEKIFSIDRVEILLQQRTPPSEN